ncbi:ABC transporter substrate-binding protein [Pelagibius sp.]|uniref:ABC transporter substrate-binding protein n=1 Tax=Pelagibius sp. TaxID=1931238 RepID=UPI003BB0EDFC
MTGLGKKVLASVLAITSSTMFAPLALAEERPGITVAVNKLPRALDPGDQTGTVDVRVYYSIFDTLIRRDFITPAADGGTRLLPGLATSWERINPTTLEFKLRQDVTCHDGNPFTADDVVATFSPERLRGAGSFYPKGRIYFSHVAEVQKVDDFTVRFVTERPDLVLEHRLSSYTSFIVCDEALNAFRKDGVEAALWLDEAAKALRWNPVGTGPYKFKDYQKNDRVTLVSHDDYFEGRPSAESITFREVPEVSARIAGVVSGEYDIAVEVPPDQWAVLDRYDDVTMKTVTLDNSHVLVFNTQHPQLQDKKLRHALSLAIDRQKLIDGLWKGQTFTPKGHQLPSFGPMYDSDRAGYVFDPEKARQLIKESGYDGEEIVYRLIPGYYLNNVKTAQAIQEMWRDVGINSKLMFVESFKKVREEDTMIYAWSNTYRIPDPTGALIANWGPNASTQRKYKYFQPAPAFNEMADRLFGMDNMAERRDVFTEMLDIFEDDMPMTILYNPLVSFAMNNRVDWTPYSLFFMDFRPSNFTLRTDG